MQILKTISSFISFTKRSKQTSVIVLIISRQNLLAPLIMCCYCMLQNWQMTEAFMTFENEYKILTEQILLA